MLIFFLLAPSIFTYQHNHSLKLENSERVQSSEFWINFVKQT